MSLRAELNLILPGYAAISDNQLNRQLLPPTLQKILRAGRFKAYPRSASRLLFEQLTQQSTADSDLPVSVLRRPQQLSLCADPCYLMADRSLLRIGSDSLELNTDEAKALIATLQPLFEEQGMQLLADSNERWSVLIDEKVDAHFHALPDIVGQPLDSQMPDGPDSGRWLQLLNACQMALFEHPVNQQREAQGLLPVNGVWFWGQGELPAPATTVCQLAGHHPLADALAQHSGIRHQTDWRIKDFHSGRHVALAPTLDTESDLDAQLVNIDDYLMKVFASLRQMKLRRFNLFIADAGVYRLNPLSAWFAR